MKPILLSTPHIGNQELEFVKEAFLGVRLKASQNFCLRNADGSGASSWLTTIARRLPPSRPTTWAEF